MSFPAPGNVSGLVRFQNNPFAALHFHLPRARVVVDVRISIVSRNQILNAQTLLDAVWLISEQHARLWFLRQNSSLKGYPLLLLFWKGWFFCFFSGF